LHPGEREDEWLAPREGERGAVAMVLAGAIAGGGVAEFGRRAVKKTVVMDVDEVDTYAPRRCLEEHLSGLASERLVDCVFELLVISGGEPLKDAIAAGCLGCLGVDIVDRGLFDCSVKECCPRIIGVEGATLDPWDREWCQVLNRLAFEVCSRNDLV
jgi:hypothetical protein